MKRIWLAVLLLSLVACAAGPTQRPERVVLPLNPSEQAYIAQIEADGRLLYEKDIRAATASDLVLERIDPADFPGFVGWVTYPTGTDYTVSFYQQSADRFEVIADVVFDGGRPPALTLSPARRPSDTEVSMLRARIVALEQGANSCSERFNTVVIPAQSADAWDVYVLAATTDVHRVQVGGHVKVTVSRSTGEVLDTQKLSKSGLALDKSGKDLPEGAKLAALTVSHIVSPMPVAIHPYVNLIHEIALVVGTERGAWAIESGRVRLLR